MAEAARQEIMERQDATASVLRAPLTPMDMLHAALERGSDMAVLEKLLSLQERWEANIARKAFDEAVADAKAAIPPVTKNAQGHSGKYAKFDAIAKVVDPVLSRNGLSYRFRTTQTDRINVTCILSHRAGHSEENTLSGPADKSGSKNDIQAIGSTLTYLQRYSLVQALGLAVTDDDDGGSAGSSDRISSDQVETIERILTDMKANRDAFLKAARVDRIDDILAKNYGSIIARLEEKRQQRTAQS